MEKCKQEPDYIWRNLDQWVNKCKCPEFPLLTTRPKAKRIAIEIERGMIAEDVWVRGYEPYKDVHANTQAGGMYRMAVKRLSGRITEDGLLEWATAQVAVYRGRVLYGDSVNLPANNYVGVPFVKLPESGPKFIMDPTNPNAFLPDYVPDYLLVPEVTGLNVRKATQSYLLNNGWRFKEPPVNTLDYSNLGGVIGLDGGDQVMVNTGVGGVGESFTASGEC